MAFLHHIGLFCLLAATVLLIITSVSVPVWHRVYFLSAQVGTGSPLRMGNWGTCVGSMCSKSKLGYDVSFIQNDSNGRVSASIIHGLTYALILNPIAAGVSFIALIFALGKHFILGLIGSIFAFFAFLVTAVALALDLALFVTAHHRLSNANYAPKYGNALWFVVAACALQLIAAFTVCFTRSRHHDREYAGDREYTADPAMSEPAVGEPALGRRHFWQRSRRPAPVAY